MISIINDINTRNKNNVFDHTKFQDAEKYINLIRDIKYFDHGSTCLCYNDNNTVYKICQKDKLNINEFTDKYNYLLSKGIDILESKIIYEDSTSFIYSQPKCYTLSTDKINDKFCCDVLNIIYKLLSINIIYPDLYYKNFGYYNGKCYIFDFHDSNVYNDDNNTFYIVGIFSLLSIYFTGKNINTIEEIKNVDYGKEIFKGTSEYETSGDKIIFYNLIIDLVNKDFKSAGNNIQKCIEYFSKNLEKCYTQYQYINIDKFGKISLCDHTLNKYLIADKVLNYNNDYKTVLDAGCCIGGIGLKIQQQFPNINVTLNNITLDEISVANEIKNNLILYNTVINKDNITSIKNKYDVCFYFSLIHHLLRNNSIDNILNIIFKQTNNYAVIEFPIKGDHLLDIVVSNSVNPINYEFLYSLDNLINTISKYVIVKEVIKVDYKNDIFKRYAIICSNI
jgi:hypothetical protein